MEYCGEVCTIADFECRKSEYSKEKRRHYYFMSLKTDEVRIPALYTSSGYLTTFLFLDIGCHQEGESVTLHQP